MIVNVKVKLNNVTPDICPGISHVTHLKFISYGV